MPTLEELRSWLKKGAQPGALPGTSKPKAEPDNDRMSKMMGAQERERMRSQFVVTANGMDAKLNFGKYKGKNISEIAREDPSYLEWMLREEFHPELKSVAKYRLNLGTGSK